MRTARISHRTSLGCIAVCLATATIALGGAPAAAHVPPGALTQQESALLATLDVPGTMARLAALSGLGERLVGTPAETAAQQQVYDALAAMPLDTVARETFRTTSWTHQDDALRVISPTAETIPTTIYAYDQGIWGRWFGVPYTRGNTNDGTALQARLVDVGLGTEADFDAARGVAGAIVLARRDDDIQGWPSTIAEEAMRRGAVAVINHGYYGSIVDPEGIKQDVTRGPIPEYAVSETAAAHLQALLAAGPVTIQLEGRADVESERTGRATNVIGYLRGTTYPDEYIVISGHNDCFWSGASDNSSSIAAMLELARALSAARQTGTFVNERTIVFASFAGEEFGGASDTWYDWLNGSYAFVQAHPEVMAGLVIDLNMDGVGYPAGPGKYWLESTWEIGDFVADAIGDLGLTGRIGTYNPVYSWTDAWSLAAKGGGSAVTGFWVPGFDAIYHTQLDTVDRVEEEPVRAILRLYALTAMRADRALVLPIDLSATADWAEDALRAERAAAPAAGSWIDRASAALATLRASIATTNARAAELTSGYAAASTDGQRAAIRAEAAALNRTLVAARRTLTSWSLGEGGTMGSWDVFLRPDQHAKDVQAIDGAITALTTGRANVRASLRSLEQVASMEWGHLFSPGTYHALKGWMINDEMAWADDFDQQQAYVDVHAIHRGLRAGTLSVAEAVRELRSIERTQLLPWLQADLLTLEQRWLEAAATL